jgi:hypothetical protein
MGTSALQAVPSTTESNVTSERQDYVVGYDLGLDKDNKPTQTIAFYGITSEEEVAAVKKLRDEKKFKDITMVTVSIPRAKNLAGIKEICPNEDEAAANFNRGARQKANNRLKAILLAEDANGQVAFDPENAVDENGAKRVVNGILDLTSEIASESKRKVLSEEEKLDRFLEQFPESTRSAMKAAYQASRQAAPAA